jgi:NAD(P)H-dependent FMN reductase
MNSLNLTILSLSASEQSISRTSAQRLAAIVREKHTVDFVDIRSLQPVWVDSLNSETLPEKYASVAAMIKESDGVVLAIPVYCYSASSPAKAITELFASSLKFMPVAMVVAAGTVRSHLAVADLMKSMMFEQNTICYPEIVVATSADMVDDCPSDELQTRLDELAANFTDFARSLIDFRKNLTKRNGNAG